MKKTNKRVISTLCLLCLTNGLFAYGNQDRGDRHPNKHNRKGDRGAKFQHHAHKNLSTALRKTGQIKSYNEEGNEIVDASQKDDGFYQKGVNNKFIRSDVKEIVFDKKSKLMWQDDESVSSITKPWLTQSNFDNANYADTSGDTATTYCSELVLADFEDWRLPTRKELQTLLNYANVEPAIHSVFLNTSSDRYWTSTNYVKYDYYAWGIYFDSGRESFISKDANYYIRCVREKN